MKTSTIPIQGILAALVLLASGCDRGRAESVGGIVQTKYPGQLTAGGASSGTIIARTAKPVVNATYAGGTPGIAGGSGGNTAGANVGGATGETGQGPTAGVTPPSGAQGGTRTPPGDYGTPAAPAPGSTKAPAATNVAPQAPAGRATLESKQ